MIKTILNLYASFSDFYLSALTAASFCVFSSAGTWLTKQKRKNISKTVYDQGALLKNIIKTYHLLHHDLCNSIRNAMNDFLCHLQLFKTTQV